MICKTQFTFITAAAILGALALCAFTSIPATSSQFAATPALERIEAVARMQQRLLNDRARLSRGDATTPSRWFEPAAVQAE